MVWDFDMAVPIISPDIFSCNNKAFLLPNAAWCRQKKDAECAGCAAANGGVSIFLRGRIVSIGWRWGLGGEVNGYQD